jgi:hypothetical protein
MIESGQDHLVVVIVGSGYQYFRGDPGDILRCEVADANYLATRKCGGVVVVGNLGAGNLRPKRPQIDCEDIRRLPRAGVACCTDDGAHAQLHPLKIRPVDQSSHDSQTVRDLECHALAAVSVGGVGAVAVCERTAVGIELIWVPALCNREPRRVARFCSECGALIAPARRPAEYKQVTVLFADVVHSMDIAAAVGAERLREIMAELFADGRRCAALWRHSGPMLGPKKFSSLWTYLIGVRPTGTLGRQSAGGDRSVREVYRRSISRASRELSRNS